MQPGADLTRVIAEQALRRSPADRAAYLDGVCAARPDLREAVKRLIQEPAPAARSDERSDAATIDSPPPVRETVQQTDTAIEEGSVIGSYRLLQELGSGGMGVVYMAEQQQPVRRRVALKVVKPGMDTREVLVRFEAERQALAMMDHPNIARVFDAASTPTGRPYFVMELVKGVPITEYCDRERLTTRQRLELFVSICRAVQHAHQKGIIHRDLKPLNILVTLQDDRPVPKVIDFGVAKALHQRLTEKTYFTRINQPVGTPAYMSPEQAEMSGLDVDTRSDIYSLGVVLYELLTGTTPFEPSRLRSVSYDEMQRILREEEPPRPSTRLSTIGEHKLGDIAAHRRAEPARLGAQIRGDLDWIVMKALEKDRTRRYETAAAFAEDVERYLTGELVVARPPSTAYRLSKFVRRNRGWLATGAALLGLLVAGTAASTWQAIRASHAEDIAQEALQDVARERDAAQAVADFLVEAFRSPDPERDGREVTVVERLDAAVAAVAERFQEAPLTKAKLLTVLGDTYTALGLADRAIPLAQKAHALRQKAGDSVSRDALAGFCTLAGAYYAAGQAELAKEFYSDALSRMKRHLGPNDPLTLVTGRSLADLLLAEGRAAEAIAIYGDVLDRQRRTLAPDHVETLTTEVNLAYAHNLAGQVDVSIASLQAALDKLRGSSLRANHPHVLATMNLLASAYLAADQIENAIELFRETLAERKKELGPSHTHTVSTAIGLAQALRKANRTQDAIALYQGTLEHLRDSGDVQSPRALVLLSSLAVAYGHAGEITEGIALLEDVVPKMRAVLPAHHREKAIAIGNLAHLLWLNGEVEKALSWQEQSLEQCRRVFGEENPRTLAAAVRLIELLVLNGQNEDALKLARRIADHVGAAMDDEALLTAYHAAHAAALLAQREFEAARTLVEEALGLAKSQELDSSKMARLEYLLGTALVGMREYAEAEKLLVRATETLRQDENRLPVLYQRIARQATASLAELYEQRSSEGDAERAAKYRQLAEESSNSLPD